MNNSCACPMTKFIMLQTRRVGSMMNFTPEEHTIKFTIQLNNGNKFLDLRKVIILQANELSDISNRLLIYLRP